MNESASLPLRDIHLPVAVSWWPPAPGWWILCAALGLVAVIAVILWSRSRERRRRRRLCSIAARELERLQSEHAGHQDDRRLVAEISILVRRLAITLFPRNQVAGLCGEKWTSWLSLATGGTVQSGDFGAQLAAAPYRREPPQDVAQIAAGARQWIRRVSAGAATP